MIQGMQKRDANSKCRCVDTIVGRLLLLGILCGGLVGGTGCQLATECGLVRGWADVNSTGSPAAIVDQMRMDAFRTAAPPNVLYEVSRIEVPRDFSGSEPDSFEVFPVDEFAQEVQQTSGEFRQPPHGGRSVSHHADQRSVTPAGAWLF